MAPISIDGTDITGATIDGQDVEEITVDGQTVFSASLFEESFEHNNLSGLYDGNVGDFNITTDEAFDGSFSLESTSGGTHDIVRNDLSGFSRGIQIDLRWYYDPNVSSLQFGEMTLLTTASVPPNDGYSLYYNPDGAYIYLRKYDNGNRINLINRLNTTTTDNAWTDLQIQIATGPTITIAQPSQGTSMTHNDSDFSTFHLGFRSYDTDMYVDNVVIRSL